MLKGIVRNLALASGLICSLGAGGIQAAEYEAELDWGKRVVLSTPVSGPVVEVNVRPGEKVEAGQVLLSLDPRPFRQKVRQARAQMDALAPDREEARREVERAEELYDRTVLSDVELEQTRIAFARLDGRYRQAQTAHELASLDLEYSRVKAPFPGVVLALHAAPGETVVATERAPALVEIGEVSSMTAVAELTPEQAAGVALGQSGTVIVDGRDMDGEVVFLREAEAGYEAGVAFSPEEALTAGLKATVELP